MDDPAATSLFGSCPTCGAELGPGYKGEACPTCGATLLNTHDPLAEIQRQSLIDLARSANEKLSKAGSQGAEQAFGMGCALGALPLGGLVLFLYVMGILTFILALIFLMMAALVMVGLATLISFYAKKRSIGETYRVDIAPEINVYLYRNDLNMQQFNQLVAETLPVDAPLRDFHYISPLPVESSTQE